MSKYSLMKGFAQVEDDDARNKAFLITDAVKAMTSELESKSADWAAWDDAYQFVQDGNKKFIEANFADQALPNLKIDALAFFDVKGKPVKIDQYDLENEKHMVFSENLKKHLSPGQPLLTFEKPDEIKSGILSLPEGFMIFAARPVVDSEMKKPIKGTVFFGRMMSPKQIERLASLTHQKVEQYNYASMQLPGSVVWAKDHFAGVDDGQIKAVASVQNNNTINSYALMYDFYGKPAVIYQSAIDRVIYSQGQASLNFLLWMILGSVFVIGGILILGVDRAVLARLIRMSEDVETVDKNPIHRVGLSGSDEISSLGGKINTMLDSINESTNKIRVANTTISMMLNSVGQGFFLFDSKGEVQSHYSLACEKLFERNPAGLKLNEILKTSSDEINEWLDQLFLEVIDFRSLSALGPQFYENSQGLKIKLEYYPVRNSKNQLSSVVCIATDVTAELEAKKQLEEQKVFAERVVKISKNKNDFIQFIGETRRLISDSEAELAKGMPDVTALYRYIHTLKGGAGAFSLDKIQKFSHQFESELSLLRNTTPALTSSKIQELQYNLKDLKSLFDSTLKEHEELLGSSALDGENRVEIPFSRLKGFYNLIRSSMPYEKLEYKFLSEFISQPIGKSFNHYNEVVNHLSERLGKMINPIQFENEDLMVCHEPYRELFTSLVHIFRNIVDHGIETPEERDLAGKSLEGTIQVSFSKIQSAQDEKLKIVIKDDGRGIDIEKIKNKLKQVTGQPVKLSDDQLVQKVFESGFSTAERVTDTSGRGVGMDAVKTACEKMNGTCQLKSVWGQGTELTITVPYTTGLSADKNVMGRNAA